MQKNILESLRNELKQIKKEGKVDNINVEQLDVEEREIHEIKNRKMKKSTLKKGLVLGATAIALMTVPVMPVQVVPAGTVIQAQAAKKDKKKPTIKFSGSSKIKATKGKSVKIPKTTAKDNKDGNVTKKIKVAVKKGSKSYSSIAKNVKANKAVKFNEAGSYVITYTVKDKAGNKATKKRYVTVKAATNKTTQQPYVRVPETTEAPATTEAPKTTEAPATTEAPKTTEAPATTEVPTVVPVPESYKNYTTKTIKAGNNSYTITEDEKFESKIEKARSASNRFQINITIENDLAQLRLLYDSPLLENSEYLKFLGKITATDAMGNDISNSVVIYDKNLDVTSEAPSPIYIYAEDKNGICNCTRFSILLFPSDNYDPSYWTGYSLLSDSPVAYGSFRQKVIKSESIESNKKLILK